MRINILLLGPARQFAQGDSVEVDLPEGARVADLRRELSRHHPAMRGALPSMRFALNQEFASDDTPVRSTDEVALIPPVSGGSDADSILRAIVTAPIVAEDVRSFVSGDPALGGIVTFEGATRAERDPAHGQLVLLDYEAYDPMALRQLERLAQDARTRWSAGKVAVVHRTGPVLPGEVSVMIAVACAHRAEAFDACRWLIDTLKRDVPIWKKDVYEDGFVRWVEPEPSRDRQAGGIQGRAPAEPISEPRAQSGR